MRIDSTFEGKDDRCIDYEGIAIIAGSTIVDSIHRVVSRLPNEVAHWVVKNITFIDFTGLSGLACQVPTSFPSQHRSQEDFGAIRLLVIVTREEDELDEKIEFRVAHEIAHHWLGHYEGSANTDEAYELQERKADSMANSWGFAGRSERVA